MGQKATGNVCTVVFSRETEKYGIKGRRGGKSAVGDRENYVTGRKQAGGAEKRVRGIARVRKGYERERRINAKPMARQGKGTVLGGRGRGTERRVESRRRETGIRVEMVGAPLDESDKKKDGGSRDTFPFRKTVRRTHSVARIDRCRSGSVNGDGV